MPDRFVLSHIRRLPLFAQLPEDQLALLSDAFRVTRYEPGEIIFRQGQPAQGMYMLVTGRAALVQQTPAGLRQVGIIAANQFLNEGALLRDMTETATFQVIEAAIVLFLPRPTFASLLSTHPALRTNLRLPNSPTPVSMAAPPQSINPVPSADVRLYFKGQRPDERLMLVTRRHWWTYLRRVWLAGVVGLLLLVGVALLPAPELRLVIVGLTLVVPGTIMLYFYLEWRNDLLVITDERIVRIENTLFPFQSHLNELPIKSVQGIDVEIPAADVFARLFRYGDLMIKTAGQAGTIKLDFIPDPERVQDIIFNRINDKSDDTERQRAAVRGEIERALGAPVVPQPVAVRAARPGLLQMRYTSSDGDTVYRKHLVFWLRGVCLPLLMVSASVVLLILYFAVESLNNAGIIVLPIAAVILIIGIVWLYLKDWDWRNDLYIIGADTITIIHRRPLWVQNEDDRILINRIDNVVVEISGLFQTLLNYGNVKMALIGDANTKLFRGVPDPRSVQAEISRRQAQARQLIIESEEHRRRAEIAGYIAAYDEAIRSGIPEPAAAYTPQSYSPSYAPSNEEDMPTGAAAPRPDYGTGVPASRPQPASPTQSNSAGEMPNDRLRPPNIPRMRPKR